jgi:hypothetical protein
MAREVEMAGQRVGGIQVVKNARLVGWIWRKDVVSPMGGVRDLEAPE